MRALAELLNRCLAVVFAGSRWLALPVVALLFLQWPLRYTSGGLSRVANDLGQWLFALYVAASITAATRAKVHLAAEGFARRYSARVRRRLRVGAIVLAQIPWALFVMLASREQVLASLSQLEAFPDTLNPGYFVIKLALWVVSGLMLMQAVLELLRAIDRAPADDESGGARA